MTASPDTTPTTAGTSVPPASGVTCEYERSGVPVKPVDLPPTSGVPDQGTVKYALTMTNGKVTLTLDRAKAPCTVNSFVWLAEQGFYNDTRCHRLADSRIFVLQCGDPTGSGSGGPGYQFANETDGSESYLRGVVAMANSGGPASNGSQFFMVWDDSTLLDQIPNYTIFGADGHRLPRRGRLDGGGGPGRQQPRRHRSTEQPVGDHGGVEGLTARCAPIAARPCVIGAARGFRGSSPLAPNSSASRTGNSR